MTGINLTGFEKRKRIGRRRLRESEIIIRDFFPFLFPQGRESIYSGNFLILVTSYNQASAISLAVGERIGKRYLAHYCAGLGIIRFEPDIKDILVRHRTVGLRNVEPVESLGIFDNIYRECPWIDLDIPDSKQPVGIVWRAGLGKIVFSDNLGRQVAHSLEEISIRGQFHEEAILAPFLTGPA